jgi:hypothetical protein
MSENGKTVFEEAAAERELDELRRAIEEARARRRRANTAFEEFLKGFGESRRAAASAPTLAASPPTAAPPQPALSRQRVTYAAEPIGLPQGDGLAAFAPAATILAPLTTPKPVDPSPLDDFAQEGSLPASLPAMSIPAVLAPGRPSPVRRAVPLIGIAVVGVLAVFLWSRGGSPEEAAPTEAAVAPSEPAASAPASATAPPATSAPQSPPPAAEISTSGRVWMRVTVDGQRVVEREVPEGTRIPLNGSQIVIRAGDAGAVRMSIAGKDQGVFGPAGQAVTRTFTVKP